MTHHSIDINRLLREERDGLISRVFLFVALLSSTVSVQAQAQRSCFEWLSNTFLPRWAAEYQEPSEVRSQLSWDMELIRQSRELDSEKRKAVTFEYSSPRPKSWTERAFVIADWAMAAILGIGVAGGLAVDPSAIVPAILVAPPALFCADLASQVFHKWLDSYASESNPVWGVAAREFRKHHEYPSNLNHTDYLSNVSAFGKLLAPAFIGASFVNWSPELGAAVWLFLVATLNTTEAHKQAHRKEPNFFFKILQKLRLTISHEKHMVHHKPPFDSEFAVLNGWSNGLNRRLDLWRRLDKIFWKVSGKMPHNWIQDPRSIPDEVVAELEAKLKEIPSELWDYAETYPYRIPERLKDPIQESKEKWRADYIQKRKVIYFERAQVNRLEAEEGFEEEQREFPWIYGTVVIPLFASETLVGQ